MRGLDKLVISEDIGIDAMVVDAIDKQAEGFYEQYGFTRLALDSGRLFLTAEVIFGIGVY